METACFCPNFMREEIVLQNNNGKTPVYPGDECFSRRVLTNFWGSREQSRGGISENRTTRNNRRRDKPHAGRTGK